MILVCLTIFLAENDYFWTVFKIFESDVLGKFPLVVRKVLISEITQTLLQAHDPNLLSSPTHVRWVMEAIGQGFALPLEEMAITANSKELYSQWLFEPNFRPAAIRDLTGKPEEQEFWQVIFHHYSLLFQPRTPNTNAAQVPTPTTPGFPASVNQTTSNYTHIQRHIELCKGVLIVLTMAGRTLGPQFSEDTWLVLLKVVLGITDCLLREPSTITTTDNSNLDKRFSGTSMGDELCEHLLRVLFELWLRSKIQNVEMWNILKKCFNLWTHRSQAIHQWNATTLALAQRVARLLYGPKEGADMVSISVGGYNVGLDLPTEFVYYAWHRMIYLIDYPCALPPSNFALAITGIGRVIDSFQLIGQPVQQKMSSRDSQAALLTMPDGNTILRMFGTWLFEACALNQDDDEIKKGRAIAYGILCRIFCSTQRHEKFLRTYITQFYRALSEGLRVHSCLPTILMNTDSLFASELEGVRMMVPDFVVGIKLILPKLASNFDTVVPLEDLRLAAIKVASTIMCLPNHFERVSLKENWTLGIHQNGDKTLVNDPDEVVINELIRVLYSEEDLRDDKQNQPSTEPFTALKFYILELLLTSLKTEKSSYNLRYLLHLINVYVVEDVAFCPGLVGVVVKTIQEKVLTMQLPSDVTLYAFDVLKDFVGLYDFIQRDSKNCARELVLAFSRYIDTLLAGGYGGLTINYPLIERAYECMIRWILIAQWIVGDRDCHEAVIATISRGISIGLYEDDYTLLSPSTSDKKKSRKETTPNKLFLPRGNRGAASSNENVMHNHLNLHQGKREEVAIKIAAEIAMTQIINHLGNFPAWADHIGPSRVSTLFKDDLQLAMDQIRNQREFDGVSIPELVRYFLIDGRLILGFVEMPKKLELQRINSNEYLRTPTSAKELDHTSFEPDDSVRAPSVTIVIRDSTGKYSWTSHMRYNIQNPDTSQPQLLSVPSPAQQFDLNIHFDTSAPSLHADSPLDSLHDVQEVKDPVMAPNMLAFSENVYIPSVDKILKDGSESLRAYNAIRKLTQKQKNGENLIAGRQRGQSFKAIPARLNANLESPQAFRLFMSQMGLLSLENRHRVVPLRISEKFIRDLEHLDRLHERECISASVFYARTGEEPYEHIINPESVNEDFEKFLNSLGWPVAIEAHQGFKGKLTPSVCRTAPYFADRNVELIFNVPYLIQKSPGNSAEITSPIFRRISADDNVCIVWIQEIKGIPTILQKIKSAMVYIFVHPLQNATGLYWIRIIILGPQQNNINEKKSTKIKSTWGTVFKLTENPLHIGPLVDGMIVSRHALGMLVRNTTISAHHACRECIESHIRPYAARRNFIDEMHGRYKTSMDISEFYSDIFVAR
ncbi:hypothetical protein G9A89_011240 [Geosiphon pyriformis]|nr:hypothetical protein G9A89_011240 [Geosiphon pyriformis]